MKREVDIEEISDGRRYTRRDLVRLGCNECEGCSACCHDMESVLLDPWDIWMLTRHLKCTFEQLLEKYIELRMTEGLILPRLSMKGENQACLFLNEQKRCSIHEARPGVCRLFPLGRIYEEDGFSYFLQVNECNKKNRTKVRIEKWLGIEKLADYEAYVLKWHGLLKNIEEQLVELDEAQLKTLQLLFLRTFFITAYEVDDFYSQFDERYEKIVSLLGL